MTPRAHLRIEKNVETTPEPGMPHVVIHDRMIAVGADGAEVDISSCVTAWHEHSQVGEARRLEVVLIGFHVTQADGTVILEAEDDGRATLERLARAERRTERASTLDDATAGE